MDLSCWDNPKYKRWRRGKVGHNQAVLQRMTDLFTGSNAGGAIYVIAEEQPVISWLHIEDSRKLLISKKKEINRIR